MEPKQLCVVFVVSFGNFLFLFLFLRLVVVAMAAFSVAWAAAGERRREKKVEKATNDEEDCHDS